MYSKNKMMIKRILLLSLLFLSLISNAQLAIIYDKDGFVNLREKPNKTSKIIGKIIEGQVFCVSPFNDENPNKDWVQIWLPTEPDLNNKTFIKYTNIQEGGYIHKSRLFYLSGLKQYNFKNKKTGGVYLENDHFQVYVETKSFKKEKHIISKNKEGGFYIDKEPYWGFLDMMPKIELEFIKFNSYNFPKQAIFGLYELNLESAVLFKGKNDELYLNMSGADGSDSYEIIWCLKNNKIFSMTVMQTIP